MPKKETKDAKTSKKTSTKKKASEKQTTKKKPSIKKEKPAPKKRKLKADIEREKVQAEENRHWKKLVEQNKGKKGSPYNIKNSYTEVNIINHKQFGLGFITAKYNNRLKVLFESGMKNLISNYKK